MVKDLVSIITPCYNGENYISRFLDSILNQTYKKIELIIINDGSYDKTQDIIMSYKEKFTNNNIDLIYIYQDNSGQAEAINKGLKVFKGEFLTWPDSDDTLDKESIKEKVEFLKKNQQYGYVRTMANIINERTGQKTGILQPKNKKNIKENLFEDLIFENDVWYAPGCYMVRSEAFIDTNPECTIYPSRGGQNWQMLLPIAYKYKCGYIPKCLYNYYVRDNSHSHSDINDINKQLAKLAGYREILNVVLSQIGLFEKYEKRLDIKYTKKRFKLAFRLNEKEMLKTEFKKLRNQGKIDFKILLMYIIRKN